MTKPQKVLSFFLAVCLLSLSCFPVFAFELNVDAYSNIEYSDNVGLTSERPQEDFYQTFGLNVGVSEEKKDFQADATFSLEYGHYYNDTFDDQTSLSSGIGVFNFDIIDSFLNWSTSFTRTEVLTNATEVDVPDNREYRDIIRTGPQITYALSSASNLRFSANYINVENSEAQTRDSERLEGQASYYYFYNELTDIFASSTYEDLLDGDGDQEFKRNTLSLGINRRFVNGSVSLEAGRSRYDLEMADARESSFYDFSFIRSNVFGNDLTVQYFEDVSDTTIGFEADETSAEESLSTARGSVTSDIVKRKRATVGLSGPISSYYYELDLFWEDEDYAIQLDDEQSHGANLRLEQNVLRGFLMGYEVGYRFSDLIERPTILDEVTMTYLVDANYDVTRNFSVNGFVGYEDRVNQQSSRREYQELSIGIGLNWNIY